MQNQNEKTGAVQDINDFIQKHRKPLFITAGALLLLLIISIAVFPLMDMYRGMAIGKVEDFSGRYETLRSVINEEYMEHDVEQLLAELESFAKKNSSYAGAKAFSIIASIHTDRKNWAEAEAAWVGAAEKSAKYYLAPVAWFNAGIAAEEQGMAEKAIEYLSKSISAPAGFSAAPRAQFSIGRLRETLDDRDAAIDAYQAVISGWPYDNVWTSLAKTRIIALELQ